MEIYDASEYAKLVRAAAENNSTDTLLAQLRTAGLPEPVREHLFHDTRKWRFDISWPEKRVAVECEGGTWIKGGGRHNRPAGYENDCRKYNEAQILGWKVLRFTTNQVMRGEALQTISKIIG